MRKTTALFQVLLTAVLLPLSAVGATAGTPADAPSGVACAPAAGVTVVVDLTDLGGDVEVGCAEGDPTTGRNALVDAGFSATDDPAGMICAVDGAPDPCPTTFKGSYWSYWTAEADADWTAYAVGADASDPAPGSFEGWRYNDGSTGPSVQAASVLDDAGKAKAGQSEPSAQAASAESKEKPSAVVAVGILAIGLIVTAGVIVVMRRIGSDRA